MPDIKGFYLFTLNTKFPSGFAFIIREMMT